MGQVLIYYMFQTHQLDGYRAYRYKRQWAIVAPGIILVHIEEVQCSLMVCSCKTTAVLMLINYLIKVAFNDKNKRVKQIQMWETQSSLQSSDAFHPRFTLLFFLDSRQSHRDRKDVISISFRSVMSGGEHRTWWWSLHHQAHLTVSRVTRPPRHTKYSYDERGGMTAIEKRRYNFKILDGTIFYSSV